MEDYYCEICTAVVLGLLLLLIIPKIYKWWFQKTDGLSEEEANYVRYLHLLLDLGAKALRQYFDSKVPPSQLKKHLAKYENDCRTKKQWGFTVPQLSVIFPTRSSFPVSSSAFDASLMYKLIRNTFSVPTPTQGCGKDPLARDTTLTDDVERIRIHRNYIAHINNPTISNKEFEERWEDLSQAIKRLSSNTLGQSICKLKIKNHSREEAQKIHADHIAVLEYEVDILKSGFSKFRSDVLVDISGVKKVTTSLSEDVTELKTDLKEMDSSHIPKNVREQDKMAMEKWFNDDQVYYETTSYQSAVTCVRSKSCLTLVGGPGVGKTATMRHIALLLWREDYIITPISDISEIKQYGQVNKKQLFLIDDVLGIFGLQMDRYNKVIAYEEQIFNVLGKTSKLLMTCRKSVYKEASKYKSFVTNPENVIDFEGKGNQLTESEKKGICESHCTHARVNTEVYENLNFDFPTGMFPLLCKFFANDVKYHNIGAHFFKLPYKYISQEIDQLQVHNPLHYAALVMCALNQNKLSKEFLDRSEFTYLKNDVLTSCEVKSSTESWEIVKALSREDGTYTTKLEHEFTLIHDFIFEVIASHYGKQNPCHILKYMSSSFICEKMCVSKQGVSDEDLKINMQKKHYRSLAERLYKDVCDMNLHDVFMNKCLYDEEFCKIFSETLESKSYEEIKSMFIYKREEVKKIVSKGESVHKKVSDTEIWLEREKQDLLVDKRDIDDRVVTYKVRVVSWIVLYGHINILQYIINRVTSSHESADLVFGCNKEEQTRLLILGCWSGNKDLVQVIINHVKAVSLHCTPWYDDDYGWNNHRNYTPLTAACKVGHLDIVTKLIEYGCDINKAGNCRNTPLTAACRWGHLNIVTKLIESECDINKAGNFRNTPLIAACEEGHLDIVTKLIESGCDINKADEDGYTPLTAACKSGHLNILTKLIESGCDVNKVGIYGYTPLTVACQGGDLNIITKLVESRCAINKTDDNGYTPLTVACQSCDLNIITKLIESGCDINKTDDNGYTPLTTACQSGDLKIVTRLRESGCDINKADDNGYTPLSTACGGGHLDIVTKLIEYGCDINKADNDGNIPLTAACEGGHLDIVTKLIES